MNPVSNLWIKKLKLHERNCNNIPAKLKDEVMQKLLEDGYTVDENGWAVKV